MKNIYKLLLALMHIDKAHHHIEEAIQMVE
jgi:hypothetical protein